MFKGSAINPSSLGAILSKSVVPKKAAGLAMGELRGLDIPAFLRRSPSGKQLSHVNDIMGQRARLAKHYSGLRQSYPELVKDWPELTEKLIRKKSGLARISNSVKNVAKKGYEGAQLLSIGEVPHKSLRPLSFLIREAGSLNRNVSPLASMYGDKTAIKLFGTPEAMAAAWISSGLGALDVHGKHLVDFAGKHGGNWWNIFKGYPGGINAENLAYLKRHGLRLK